MKFWFDTEFIEDGKTIELISIGMVREDELTYYAEVQECDHSRASDWVKENVLPHLKGGDQVKTKNQIRRDIIGFIGGHTPEFWAYYADYDWVALCQLYGTMMDLPKGWPMYCRDLKQWADSLGNPKFPDLMEQLEIDKVPHNSISDAIECKMRWQWLNDYSKTNRYEPRH